jgi:hypothetical protein
MKPKSFSRIPGQSRFLRTFRLALAAPSIIITLTVASAETAPAPAAAPAESTDEAASNWVTFTIGGAFVSGDDTAFSRRTQTNDGLYGGIESMFYSQELNDSTTLTLDGHILPGLEDYEFNMDLQKADLGYVKAGFKQFRTWYDASGGYLEGSNMAASRSDSLFDDERSIDRGEIYLETGLRMENLPEVTFSYRHLYRDGQKDSLSWGDTRANTAWGGITGSNPAFKLMPALWTIDETTDIFELDVEHTLGNTDLGMGLVYESYDLDNSRYTPRWGTKPNAAPPTATGVTAITEATLTEKTDADIFAGNIHSVTRFNDKAWLSFAASYSSMDTDIDGGTRSYGAYWALPGQTIPGPSGGANARRDYAYDQMTGGSTVAQFITNLNFMWVPVQDLTVTPSLRYEHEDIDTVSSFRAYNTNQTWQGLESLGAFTEMDSTTTALDVRYTGISDIVLYAKGEWGWEDESIHRLDRYMLDAANDPDADGEFLDTGVDINEQEYVLGANWYALRNLSFAVQGFHSQRDQSLNHYEGNQQFPAATPTQAQLQQPGGANNFRPIMVEHDTEVDDINLRMTWRPVVNVSLVTRYDYSHTEYDNKGINWSKNTYPTATTPNIDPAVFYPMIESGDVSSHILSQSVSWNPIERLYLLGSVSWVSSETDTPERYTNDSDNDYLVGTLSAGYSIDARTDITASYSYYGASNYITSAGYTGINTMGYGLNTEEHAISLTLTRLINENMIWNLRYGFITSNTDPMPDQSGGWNDFDAHMVSTGLQVRF